MLVGRDYGTFKDCLTAPVHRWFKYPAGYSYRLIRERIKEYGLGEDDLVLDPFVGSGTTLIEAMKAGVPSVGVEMHPFVAWVARVKTRWDLDTAKLRAAESDMARIIESYRPGYNPNGLPPLVRKCYSAENLGKLVFLREAIEAVDWADDTKEFFRLALVDTLRTTSVAGTGWPYIAPTRYHAKTTERDAFAEFKKTLSGMIEDLEKVKSDHPDHARARVIEGDARHMPEIESSSVSLAITSPPYLNNYDYADRTRLEMYFMGWAGSWRDITKRVRDRLMIAATTQIRRSEFDPHHPLSDEVRCASLEVHEYLSGAIVRLGKLRREKPGKKSYDLMVAGYFNDMVRVLKEVKRCLKPGADFILVVGDSAPYGVHIPTDELIGKLALGVGFRDYGIEILRKRGEKWRENPQRHKVGLRESLILLGT
ncbi:MAG: DNA methyltransferase [candidate division WOR-3 bacterium]